METAKKILTNGRHIVKIEDAQIKTYDHSLEWSNEKIRFCIKLANKDGYIWKNFDLVRYKKYNELNQNEKSKYTKSKKGGFALRDGKRIIKKRCTVSAIHTIKNLCYLFDIYDKQITLYSLPEKIIGKELIIEIYYTNNVPKIYIVGIPNQLDHIWLTPIHDLSDLVIKYFE